MGTLIGNGPKVDTMDHVLRGGSIVYIGGSSDEIVINPGSVNNKIMIVPSIRSSPSKGHGFREDIRYNIVPTVIGNDKYFGTASNIYMFNIEDKINLPHWEESDSYIEPWKAATERNNVISYSKPTEFKGMIVAADYIVADPLLNKIITPILAYQGPFNEVGPNLSRAFNVRLMRKMYRESIEHERSVESSIAHGYDKPIEEIGYGVGFLPKNAAAGVTWNGIFLANRNLSNIVKAWAEKYDVPEHVVLAYLNVHETKHLSGLLGDIPGERELEYIIGNEFEELAKNEASGMAQIRTGYKQIARIARHREANVIENYGYKNLFRLPFAFDAMEKAVDKYTDEALAMGIEDVEEYVEAKLSDEYERSSNAKHETSEEESSEDSVETLESKIENDGESEVRNNIIKFPDRDEEYASEEDYEPETEMDEMDEAA